jgi:hypothetical protein
MLIFVLIKGKNKAIRPSIYIFFFFLSDRKRTEKKAFSQIPEQNKEKREKEREREKRDI